MEDVVEVNIVTRYARRILAVKYVIVGVTRTALLCCAVLVVVCVQDCCWPCVLAVMILLSEAPCMVRSTFHNSAPPGAFLRKERWLNFCFFRDSWTDSVLNNAAGCRSRTSSLLLDAPGRVHRMACRRGDMASCDSRDGRPRCMMAVNYPGRQEYSTLSTAEPNRPNYSWQLPASIHPWIDHFSLWEIYENFNL